MNSKINELIAGVYQYNGEAICYSDTDSSYFSIENIVKKDPELAPVLDDKDKVIELYETVAETVNSTFPQFMTDTFNTGLERGSIIKGGLELIASRGLFIKKKRYAVLKYWDDGYRVDVDGKPGKIKAMGLDLKRSDTPKLMQDFLEEVLIDVLTGANQDDIINKIKEFRKEFNKLDGWLKGTPKKVNGLSYFVEQLKYKDEFNPFAEGTHRPSVRDKKKPLLIPGHVQASINWNNLRRQFHDNYSMEIQDGAKVIVCKLKQNALKMTSIAYPYDQASLPEWFRTLPFDHDTMEETIIDQKLQNLIGVLKWDLKATRDDTTFNDLFDF